MLKTILQPEVQQYIRDNEHVDINQLLLKGVEIAGVTAKNLATQISGRQKAKSKLPEWYRAENIIFPTKISMEQCSSEQTANYKATIIKGDRMIDLTGGAGVDVFAFSNGFGDCTYIEQNTGLYDTASHNLSTLGADNVTKYNATAEQFLEENNTHFDLIYLDPTRRDDSQKKVFRFEDCTPNVVEFLSTLLNRANHIMIKTAPFLDITQALSQLDQVKEIHVVAVNNECKEVLYLLSNEVSFDHQISVNTVNLYLDKPSQIFSFLLQEELEVSIKYSVPNKYIYEPNTAILKSGGINNLGLQYGLDKLHPNSQLFTSESLVQEFPGRIFECTDILKYDKKVIKKVISSGKANITTRNFPYSVAQIRKKTGLKDGGNEYLFATTNINDEKLILRTKKLSL